MTPSPSATLFFFHNLLFLLKPKKNRRKGNKNWSLGGGDRYFLYNLTVLFSLDVLSKEIISFSLFLFGLDISLINFVQCVITRFFFYITFKHIHKHFFIFPCSMVGPNHHIFLKLYNIKDSLKLGKRCLFQIIYEYFLFFM